ncbi:PfkB family carbohydrate kinase [Roseateles cellulosilyticus]|uniref:PfkB family carbohydrate kinase n=1 Tax=Pelomonas cellulosilytica TaxID=2906762 RepID=A0ABS8XZ91_9BURK|nr:PfkB family carbohydrate kinase [Pelomonas sp. P8]MCE4556623.1 PfkB family carbohydrate kinase [Pelomonas sp. P8]
MTAHPVLVLGEALVDEFHDGAVAGGAPFNVARSLAALGAPVRFVSRIGLDDMAGRLLLDSASRYGLAVDDIQRDASHATGRVSVHEEGGGHRFEIHADAAWDHLAPPAPGDAGLVYFGSLAQRHVVSRSTLRALLKRSAGRRLLDLNLRAGADTPALAAESLMLADWVKLNEDELERLLAWFEPTLPALMARFALERVVLTRGASGYAFFGIRGQQIASGEGVDPPAFVDSVGAGDGFTAMLLAGLALGRDLDATLHLANRYAAMICGVRGPLPADPAALSPWREALHQLPAAEEGA